MIDDRIEWHRRLFDWCVANARDAATRSDATAAAHWLCVAAEGASGPAPFDLLCSSDFEAVLRQVGATLPSPRPPGPRTGPLRCLHVVSEVYPIFGHSAMLRRWIEMDDASAVHHVVATAQSAPFPPEIARAVAQRGGQVTLLDPTRPPLDRAGELRQLAWALADLVILHVHPSDLAAPLAFAIAGGPPVAVVNHADHLFWPGASVTDLAINLRRHGREAAERCRSIARQASLPIPLPDPPAADLPSRQAARVQLGVDPKAVVLLTIGQHYKFQTVRGLDFFAAAWSILQADASHVLIAVGLNDNGPARELSRETHGRFRPVGPQKDLAPYFAAADAYLEGFPVVSVTALLEAAQHGLPCVLAPRTVPPLFISDAQALSLLDRPADPSHYARAAIALAGAEPAVRLELGERLRQRVIADHGRQGWGSRLRDLYEAAPRTHDVRVGSQPAPIPAEAARYWASVMANAAVEPRAALIESIRLRLVRPTAPVPAPLWRAARRCDGRRLGRIALRCDRVLPIVGQLGAGRTWRRWQAEYVEESARRLWLAGRIAEARCDLWAAIWLRLAGFSRPRLLVIFLKSLLGGRLLGKIRQARFVWAARSGAST